MEPKVFNRFKYAEEHAHDLAKAGKRFKMWNVLAAEHEDDDGIIYVYDEYWVQEVTD